MSLLFWRHRKPCTPPLKGFTDWHSHILPGVDDGVGDMAEAIAILQQYEAKGIEEVWLTPHIMEDIPNTTGSLRERFAALQEAYTGKVRLHLGSENMMDNLFEERLNANDFLPVGENRLLIETSYFNPPLGMKDTIKKIKEKGYTPVLAHPERYIYMTRDEYRELKREDVLFQLNMLSFSGYYGREAGDKARWLHKQGMCDLFGTDLHNIKMTDWL